MAKAARTANLFLPRIRANPAPPATPDKSATHQGAMGAGVNVRCSTSAHSGVKKAAAVQKMALSCHPRGVLHHSQHRYKQGAATKTWMTMKRGASCTKASPFWEIKPSLRLV